jgi:5-formyltetrahydrofolate cyclo-ligase
MPSEERDSIRARKRALRRTVVAQVLALEPVARRADEAVLADTFPGLAGFAPARTVLLYFNTFPEEIATGPLLAEAFRRGKAVILPRVDRAERRLRLFRVDDPERDLAPGTRGIPEPRAGCPEIAPAAVDWVLVPGLAFDARGYRIGRGGGHYDRLLPLLRADVLRWALIHDCQWVDELPLEPHDVPLDGVVSPRRYYSALTSTAGGLA